MAGRQLILDLLLNNKEFAGKLQQSSGDVDRFAKDVGSSSSSLDRMGQGMTRAGGTLTKTLTPAAAGMGLMFKKAFDDFDAGADTIVAKAGLTGDALDGAIGSMKNIGGEVNASLATIGTALADVAASADLTGPPLEDVTQRLVEMNKMGQELTGQQVGEFLKNWGIGASDAAPSLDRLFGVSQKTGVGVGEIMDQITASGPILREFGLSWDQSAMFVAKMAEQGIPAADAIKGMQKTVVASNKEIEKSQAETEKAQTAYTKAVAEFGKESPQAIEANKKVEASFAAVRAGYAAADLPSMFRETVEAIANAGDAARGNNIAIETFGAKAGPVLAQQIREGKVSVQDFTDVLPPAADEIGKTYQATLDWGDKLEMLKNKVFGVLGPVGEYGMAIAGVSAGIGPLLSAGGKIVAHFVGTGAAAASSGTMAAAGSTGFWAMAAGVWATVAPFLAVAAVVAVVVGIGYLLIKNWDTIRDAVVGAAKAVWNFFKDNWQTIGALLLGPFGWAVKFIMNHWEGVKNFFAGIPEFVGNAFQTLADIITWPFRTAFNAVAGLWNNTIGSLSFTFPSWVPGLGGKGFDVPNLPTFHTGGIVPGTPGSNVPIMAQAGERVRSLAQGDGGGGLTVIVEGSVITWGDLVSKLRDELGRDKRMGG